MTDEVTSEVTTKNQIAIWTHAWTQRAGLSCWLADSTDSTNGVAKDDFGSIARSPLAPCLYVAGHQSAGRGRGANTWTDMGDGALLSSWSFHTPKPPQPVFSPLIGLAVYQAVSKVWPKLHWSLKAPNDLYLEGRKMAGILIETVDRGTSRRTIVGLGMNITKAPASIVNSVCLNDVLPETEKITPDVWGQCLQALLVQFMAMLAPGQQGELSPQSAKAIKDALNRNTTIPEQIEKVGPKGELYTSSGVIPWHTL